MFIVFVLVCSNAIHGCSITRSDNYNNVYDTKETCDQNLSQQAAALIKMPDFDNLFIRSSSDIYFQCLKDPGEDADEQIILEEILGKERLRSYQIDMTKPKTDS